MLFEQMPEPANRRFIGYRLAPQIDPDKAPHRLRIVERLFDPWIRQVEPLLQEVDAQHPFHPDRRPAIAGLRIERLLRQEKSWKGGWM